jgi:hypothetical protein
VHPVWRRHLESLASGFKMEPSGSAIEFPDPENTGVAVGILFLGALDLEIRWG